MSDPKFLQKINLKKGALSKELGIPEDENIPCKLLYKLNAASSGDNVKNPTNVGKLEIYVTKKMKKRVNLALTLKRIHGQCNL